MKLQVSHFTKYFYQEPVEDSVNEVRLTPITDDHQTCCNHTILLEPTVPLFSYKDYFGNVVHHFTIQGPHQRLVVESRSIVETEEKHSVALNQVSYGDECEILDGEMFQNQYAEFLIETNYTRITPELRMFCASIHQERVSSVYELLEQISHLLFSRFTYDTDASNVHTTVEETLRLNRGVCQDYAHVMIAICRMYGIPARYVSGYHFIGDVNDDQTEIQHASHAWVEAYVPFVGWIGFDPTNNGKIDWRYIKIGHGRNYSDIVPFKGVYQGAGTHDLDVFVDIRIYRE
ncbi:transglutaminase family protein [Halalkalibacter kiskunsagensis]|uniref:Transglutaminase family protein n=1 Tax=Halalkalibacter kiskunsagensis TaxID=1548599 RepID=A0ABV6KDK6_9BACI